MRNVKAYVDAFCVAFVLRTLHPPVQLLPSPCTIAFHRVGHSERDVLELGDARHKVALVWDAGAHRNAPLKPKLN